MFKLLGNTHVPHRKNTANMPAVAMPPPKEVVLLASQHIGAPARVVVKAGDEVKVGQLIAEAGGYVSAPVHASVSGKVLAVEPYLTYGGQLVDAVRIESDGEMACADTVVPPEITDLDSFVEAVRASGSVGLGGAGFPTAVKLDALKRGGIDTLVINGAECEPYITADTRTMLDECESIKEGIELFERFAPDVKEFVFGIESNKPE
ncbi:MAG: electron transport complex subunit RsxC, partial [Clostridia bacterium]|nr:electron transport complex subunit RsxC [Clostridia bacterium]